MTQTLSNHTIFVYGASGHGKVVADILLARGVGVAGFVDDNAQPGSAEVLGLVVLGGGNWLAEQAKSRPVAVALGIGDNFARQEVANRCIAGQIQLLTAVHPFTSVAPSARIGPGVVVMAGAVINPDAKIGTGAIVNTGAIVEHDCQVGDFAHLSPNAAMGGCARLGSLSWLGIGATIIHGVTVGSGAIVGAGAVVVRDIPDAVLAVGVPARIQRQIPNREK
jgi:sugar O-acyltransferase (sialic acid O-acetyltransferase NeuD family)